MSRKRLQATELTLWAGLGILSLAVSLLLGAKATPAQAATSERATYAINKISNRNFEIHNSERSLRLELIPGDGSLIKINDVVFALDLEKTRHHNEARLSLFLEVNYFTAEDGSALSRLKNILIPSVHAEDWMAQIDGPRGLAQVIMSLVYLNKNSLSRKEEGFPSSLRTRPKR